MRGFGLAEVQPCWPRTMRRGLGAEFIRIVKVIYDFYGANGVLDLGCREAPATKQFRGVWIDLEPIFSEPHALIIKGDIRSFDTFEPVKSRHFSLLTMFDVLEHLTREDGLSVLHRATDHCDAAMIFTPIGELWVHDPPGPSPHEHRSGWYPEEFWANGWTVWEWPIFHQNEGSMHGAFMAWKGERHISVKDAASAAGVVL